MEVLNSVTTKDFKNYFPNAFKYLILWDDKTSYKINTIVYYKNNCTFYQSLQSNNIGNLPTEVESKYWQELPEEDYFLYTSDEDITKAMIQAKYSLNVDLFKNSQELLKIVYLLLTAHYIVIDGLMNNNGGVASYIMSSKSVEGVSASYSIPTNILNNPIFNSLGKTEFGLKYLGYLIPRLNGYCKIVKGTTTIF